MTEEIKQQLEKFDAVLTSYMGTKPKQITTRTRDELYRIYAEIYGLSEKKCSSCGSMNIFIKKLAKLYFRYREEVAYKPEEPKKTRKSKKTTADDHTAADNGGGK
jgi:hypothetical protein